MTASSPSAQVLFQPFRAGGLSLPNRIVMAPMTRSHSPGGVPTADVAAYYRRRAEGGTGLIITEGTWIPHAAAANDHNVPRFYGEDALAGWAEVLRQVHGAGARIIPQLWHIGISPKSEVAEIYDDQPEANAEQVGPSGLVRANEPSGRALSSGEILQIAKAYVTAAETAFRMGFDGVELHAAHGYLLDQFLWPDTNIRTDQYGGDLVRRSQLLADVVRGIKRRTHADFPVMVRFSQWKMQDYAARPWASPDDLEGFLAPLVDAGVDIFHCSQRRFWNPEFAGSDLNLAGWTKKLSGKPTITVGSASLSAEMIETLMEGAPSQISTLDPLLERLERNEFDLVAIGRAMIANPDWANKVRHGDQASLVPFSVSSLAALN